MASPKPPFRVSYLYGSFNSLTRSVKLAERPSISAEIRFLLRFIEHTLQHTPRTWGDPYFNLADMKAVLYRRSMLTDGLRVEYLVHNSQPVVIVRSISSIKGGPLDPDPA
jgi:hypothetical protein